MNIEVGQIWKRINPMHNNEMYFPKKGWKVKIINMDGITVTHKVVEYNGEPRESIQTSLHFIDDFLSMYELDEK